MQFSNASSKLLLASAFLLQFAAAYTPVPGEVEHCSGYSKPSTDVNRCRTQTGPRCTFNFVCSQDPVDDEIDGAIYIFNNKCECINDFYEYQDATTGSSSVFPFLLQTANLSPGLLHNVTVLHTDCAADPTMQWKYDGKTYDQDVCDCENDSTGLTGINSCRCTFPC